MVSTQYNKNVTKAVAEDEKYSLKKILNEFPPKKLKKKTVLWHILYKKLMKVVVFDGV